ncbi:MAG: lactate utilization protein C [Sporolactobacillus sp.]|jgi:L-lactate dehydrogenase complex protein LldG|nr:lactate utilization protein C [Sporolactobacillus sp.]
MSNMSGSIENRDIFLAKVAGKLHRTPGEPTDLPDWTNQPQRAVYRGATQNELKEIFKRACEPVHTTVNETDAAGLAAEVAHAIDAYGAGSIIATDDDRFAAFGLDALLKKYGALTWKAAMGRSMIEQASKANIGLSICDVALAESASAGFFNDGRKARSVSLLPEKSIVIIPESLIVPRLTQAMDKVEQLIADGKQISHYINFVSGPSNSADIEMRLVVGVHGPIRVAYLVVRDL